MEPFRPPEHLSLTGNLGENWRRWYQRFELYLKASGKAKADESIKVAILLHCVGPEALEVYNTFVFTDDGDKEKLKPVSEQFENYCNPRKNVVMERYLFWECKQGEGESIDQFLTELKTKAKGCEFEAQKDSMIRDRIIFGIQDTRLKERLLRDSANPSLERVVELCRAAEASRNQLKTIAEGEKNKEVHAIAKNKAKHSKDGARPKEKYKKSAEKTEKTKTFKCKKCGTIHGHAQCPAHGKECLKCKKFNHFAKMCRTNISKVHVLDEGSDSEDSEFFVGVLKGKDGASDWTTTMRVGGKPINFKLDTGAEVNVLPASLHKKLSTPLKKTRHHLSSYGDYRIDPVGITTLKCRTKSATVDLEFYVADVNSKPLLGLKACEELNLIQKVQVDHVQKGEEITEESLLRDNKSVFHGLGCFEGQYHIEIDKTVEPVINPPRKVPQTLLPKLKETLKKLEEEGVICAVDQPTEWVNSLVILEKKNGSLRLCLDPRDLNKAIKREHFRIPTVDDITSQLSGKTVFSILDEKNSFWQVELDEESSLLPYIGF